MYTDVSGWKEGKEREIRNKIISLRGEYEERKTITIQLVTDQSKIMNI